MLDNEPRKAAERYDVRGLKVPVRRRLEEPEKRERDPGEQVALVAVKAIIILMAQLSDARSLTCLQLRGGAQSCWDPQRASTQAHILLCLKGEREVNRSASAKPCEELTSSHDDIVKGLQFLPVLL